MKKDAQDLLLRTYYAFADASELFRCLFIQLFHLPPSYHLKGVLDILGYKNA